MSSLLDKPIKRTNRLSVDRPAWIPDHIIENWDPSPYAYQTEEELMPAGGPHGRILAYILSLVMHLTESKGMMFLLDTFMLYRGVDGRKRRIAPDLLLMPFDLVAPSAYDLDTQPPPPLVVEVTSPDSHVADLQEKSAFYMGLGISTYLVVDAVTPTSKLRKQINLYLWRLIDGKMQQMQPDSEGYFTLPELDIGILADGQQIIFKDMETDEIVKDSGQLIELLNQQRQDLDEERRARIQAEDEISQLKAQLEQLRSDKEK